MASVGEISVEIKAGLSQFNIGINQATNELSKFGTQGSQAVQKVGHSLDWLEKFAIRATIYFAFRKLVNVSKDAIKTFGEFEKQVLDLSVVLDRKSLPVLGEMQKAFVDMARTSAFSMKDLGKGLNEIVQANIPAGATSIRVLKESSDLALVGLGSLTSATDILTTAINSYGLKTNEIRPAVNAFFSRRNRWENDY